MIRKIALAGAAAAISLAGLAALGGTAGSAPITVDSIDSANISCNLAPTKAKLKPGLVNNWVQANHNGINDVGPAAPGADANLQEVGFGGTWNDNETNPYVKAIPNTKFSSDLDNTVSSNSKTVSCTGSVTAPEGTFAVTSVKIKLGNFTTGVDNPPLNANNTCSGLLAGTPAGDVGATYKAEMQPKLSGAKLSPTKFTVNGLELEAGGGGAIGFQISGGTSPAPFNGATSKTTAYVPLSVVTTVGATPATSAAPTPAGTGTQCQASLKVKADKPGKPGTGSASLKKPKGFKTIPVGNNPLPPNQPSNICIRKGSACP
jgi:hypothetical protein